MSSPFNQPGGGMPGSGGYGQYAPQGAPGPAQPPAGPPPWHGPAGAAGPEFHAAPTGGPSAPSAAKKPADPKRLAAVALGVLGILNVVWGFLPALSNGGESMSVFTIGAGSIWLTIFAAGVPVVLLVAGLIAVGSSLGGGPSRAGSVVVLSVLGVLGALITIATDGLEFSLGRISGGELPSDVDRGIGLILLLIFAIIEALVAVYAWLLEAGVITPAAAKPAPAMPQWGYGQPGPAAPAPQGPPPAAAPGGGVPPAPPSGSVPPAPPQY